MTATDSKPKSDTAPGCAKLTPAAVEQLDAIARDKDALESLQRAFEFALADVNRRVKHSAYFHAETIESHLWHLLRLARLLGILEAPGIMGRQPHIERRRD